MLIAPNHCWNRTSFKTRKMRSDDIRHTQILDFRDIEIVKSYLAMFGAFI